MEVNINFVIALIGIILAIFGSAWLNNQQLIKILTSHKDELGNRIDGTNDRIEQLEKRIDNRIDQLEKRMDDRFNSVENRIDKIERQLEQIFKPVLPR